MKLIASQFRLWAFGPLWAALLWTGPAWGQWLTQSIQLNPGWNAVHLDVAPYPTYCDELFAGLPVETVWKWNRTFSTAQFTTDPNELIKPSPDWLMWRTPASGTSFLNTLGGLEANTAYMIHVATNAAAFNWSFKGRVVVPWSRWYPYCINLMGLMVNPTRPPTIAEYFRPTDEVAAGMSGDAQIFRIRADGTAEGIRRTANYKVEPNVAYWIGANNPNDYSGPLDIVPKGGLDYGEELQYLELTIQNTFTNKSLVLSARPRVSEAPPAGQPELAGAVPLAYYDNDLADTNASPWISLSASGITQTVGPAQTWTLLLAIRRTELAAYEAQGTNGAAYQSWLEITDSDQAWLARVPITAEQGEATSKRKAGTDALPATFASQGLWHGNVVLDQVSAPHFTGTNVVPTPSPFTFTLLVHVDGSGQARLLQHITLALANVGKTTNQTYILLGSMNPSLPTGTKTINRISSAAFPVMDPLPMTGDADMADGTLTASICLGANDPMNPFLHLYHPMHDNQDADSVKYTDAVETLAITRNITLQFAQATNAPDEMAHAIWGANFAEGSYQEVISGLQRDSVTVSGHFYLRRISQDGELD